VLLLVLILVLIAFGLLVVALLTGSVLWAWVSVGVSVAAAAVLMIDWMMRRSAVRAGSDAVATSGGSAPGYVPPRVPEPRPAAPSEPVTEVLPVLPATGAGAGGPEATSRLSPPAPSTQGASPSHGDTPREDAAREAASGGSASEATVNGIPQAAARVPFGQAPDGDSTVVMPVVRPSGSAGRPSGATPGTTSSSEVQSRSVAETGPAEPASPSLTKGSSSKSEVDIDNVDKAARGPGNSSAESWAGTRSAPDTAFGRDAGGPSERSRIETGSAVAAAAAGFAGATGASRPSDDDPTGTGARPAAPGTVGEQRPSGATRADATPGSAEAEKDAGTGDAPTGREAEKAGPAVDVDRDAAATVKSTDVDQPTAADGVTGRAGAASTAAAADEKAPASDDETGDPAAFGAGAAAAAGTAAPAGGTGAGPGFAETGARSFAGTTEAGAGSGPTAARAAEVRPDSTPGTSSGEPALSRNPDAVSAEAGSGAPAATDAPAAAGASQRSAEDAAGPPDADAGTATAAQATAPERGADDAGSARVGDRPATVASRSTADGPDAATATSKVPGSDDDAPPVDRFSTASAAGMAATAGVGGLPAGQQREAAERDSDSTATTSEPAAAEQAEPAPAETASEPAREEPASVHDVFAAPPSFDEEPPEEHSDGAVAQLVAGLDDEVVVVDEQPRYHTADCRGVAAKPVIPLPVREAVELGFTPCAWCSPNRRLAGQHPAAAR